MFITPGPLAINYSKTVPMGRKRHILCSAFTACCPKQSASEEDFVLLEPSARWQWGGKNKVSLTWEITSALYVITKGLWNRTVGLDWRWTLLISSPQKPVDSHRWGWLFLTWGFSMQNIHTSNLHSFGVAQINTRWVHVSELVWAHWAAWNVYDVFLSWGVRRDHTANTDLLLHQKLLLLLLGHPQAGLQLLELPAGFAQLDLRTPGRRNTSMWHTSNSCCAEKIKASY